MRTLIFAAAALALSACGSNPATTANSTVATDADSEPNLAIVPGSKFVMYGHKFVKGTLDPAGCSPELTFFADSNDLPISTGLDDVPTPTGEKGIWHGKRAGKAVELRWSNETKTYKAKPVPNSQT